MMPVIQPELPIVEEEEISEESAVESDPVAEQKPPRNPGGRPRKENMKRVNIKLDEELVRLTENTDRSALINKLLRAHFGIAE